MHTFYAFDWVAKKAWKFRASTRWYEKHDNGCAVSIGFRVPDELSLRQLKALKATEVTYDEWNHSSCQSGCVKRGDAKCVW